MQTTVFDLDRVAKAATMLALVVNTRDFYAADTSRRAVVGVVGGLGYCVYSDGEGRCCAIGRLIPEDKYSSSFERRSAWMVLSLTSRAFDGFPTTFFSSLQVFHDTCEYWCADGLTAEGVEAFNDIVLECVAYAFGVGSYASSPVISGVGVCA